LFQLLKLKYDEKISCFFDPNRWLDPEVKELVQEADVPLLQVKNNKVLQMLIDSYEYDRLYSALPYRYHTLDFSSVEFILSILGLRGLEMPTDKYELLYDSSFLNRLRYVYKNLDRGRYVERTKSHLARLLSVPAKKKSIIAISKHTKYSLLSYFPKLQPEDIRLLYAPRTRMRLEILPNSEEDILLARLGLEPKKFYLLVSSNRWIKNAFRAVKALDTMFTDYPELDKRVLVLGFDGQPFHKLVRNKERFTFYGYVTGIELELLYQNAYVFVYPTLNEGFGYPPLEAMKYGTPVICSAIASTVEVCGDAALYFNPFSIDEIKNRLFHMIFEPGTLELYSELGKKQSAIMAQKQDSMLDELCQLVLFSNSTMLN